MAAKPTLPRSPVFPVQKTVLPPSAAPARTKNGTPIQMHPSEWKAKDAVQTVLGLKTGNSLFGSYWSPVRAKVNEYRALPDHQYIKRGTTLTELEAAIKAWRDHQATSAIVKNTKLVGDKRAALLELERLIAAERDEIRLADVASSSTGLSLTFPPKATTSMPIAVSKPMAIGKGTTSTTTTPVRQLSDLPTAMRGSFRNRAPAPAVTVSTAATVKFRSMHVYVHYTKKAYLPGIFETGLVPGAQQGIGMPETREVDTSNVYVLSGSVGKTTSAVMGESGGEAVVVISAAGPTSPDPQYPNKDGHRGAYFYTGSAPPVRDAGTTTGTIFSFVPPLSPRSRQGLGAFLNRMMAPITVSDAEAETLVMARLQELFPLHFR